MGFVSCLLLFSLQLVFFNIFSLCRFRFSVIFLLAPLSTLSHDFVSYSLVVTFNYVITSTSILSKALCYSKVVNNWRRSLIKTFLLNFLNIFLCQKLSTSPFFFFFNTLSSCLLWGLDCESLLILLARCTFVGLRVLVTISNILHSALIHLWIIHPGWSKDVTTQIQLEKLHLSGTSSAGISTTIHSLNFVLLVTLFPLNSVRDNWYPLHSPWKTSEPHQNPEILPLGS